MNQERTEAVKDPRGAAGESQRFMAMHNARTGRRYAKATALMLLAVLAGVIIGVGCTVLYFNNRMHRPPPRGDAIAAAIMKRLDELVKLTPDEERRLREITDVRMKEVDGIRKGSFADIRRVFDVMHGEIGEVIGPERAKVWTEYRDKRWRNKRRDHKRPHDDDGR